MKVKIDGRVWTIKTKKGLSDSGIASWGVTHHDTRTIVFDTDLIEQSPQFQLETELHELIHATYDFLDENAVEFGSYDVAQALWKLGYRKVSLAKDE